MFGLDIIFDSLRKFYKSIVKPRLDLEIVVTADFRNLRRERYTILILLQLESWHLYGGRSRTLPFTIISIGTPPHCIVKRAKELGVKVVTHEAVEKPLPVFMNKSRAWQREIRASKMLMLDADILFMGDPLDLIAPNIDIQACTAHCHRIQSEWWPGIYRRCGVREPTTRLSSGCNYLGLEDIGKDLYPYFNGGVLVLPTTRKFYDQWIQYAKALATIESDDALYKRNVCESEQSSLAVAMQQHILSGGSCKLLSYKMNVPGFYIFAGKFKLEECRLFHIIGYLKSWQDSVGKKNLGNAVEELANLKSSYLEQCKGYRDRVVTLNGIDPLEPEKWQNVEKLFSRISELLENQVNKSLNEITDL